MTIEQPSMFPDEYPDQVIEDKVVLALELTPREPGWVLLRRGRTARGWHKVKATGPYGEHYALCGLVGALIPEDEQIVPMCPACAALQHEV